jgi:hypothetical protein
MEVYINDVVVKSSNFLLKLEQTFLKKIASWFEDESG